MRSFEVFVENQNKIYAKIQEHARGVRESGLEPDPALKNRMGGFFISLVHPSYISEAAERFSRRVAEIVPAIIYESRHIHTTLVRFKECYGKHFYFDGARESHRKNLASLVIVGKKLVPFQCVIEYSGFILTPNSIIACGGLTESYPEFISQAEIENYFQLISRARNACQELNIPVDIAWGDHITVSRFTEAVSPGRQLDELLQLIQNAEPFGLSYPMGVAAGYTYREPRERFCEDLRETPGHFRGFSFFSAWD